MAADEQRRHRLKMVISTEAMPAAELAALISALDDSFSVFARRRAGRGPRPRLAVSAVEQGSIELILEAIDGAKKVVDAGALLAPWATHLADVYKWYLLTAPPKIAPADRKVIEAVSHTIVKDNATQVTLVNHGTVIFNVGPSEARGIQRAMMEGRAESSKSRSLLKAPPSLLDQGQLDRLHSGELIGTAHRAAGGWFGRLESGHGVLVPIHARTDTADDLIEGQLYRFRGSAEICPRGETVGISLTAADPLR